MNKINFSGSWSYKRLEVEEDEKEITVPHDAMFYEKRSKESMGGKNTGWFEGYDYVYTKKFFLPTDAKEKMVVVEFEGVYRNAEVFINGHKAGYRPYGYTNFYVDLTPFIKYDEENEIKVIARNKEQPSSRWYTGAGLYRPVFLYIGNKTHIAVNGVKIRTLKIQPIILEVEVKTKGLGHLKVSIMQEQEELIARQIETVNEITILRLNITNAKLWNPDEPNLCQCIVEFEQDTVTEQFGIRSLCWDIHKGLLINHKRVVLRGACIHHDNGILGACAFEEAEERKVRLLKNAGYNAIRSAHNPCSKALLNTCDKLGMLVMDEYLDMWYIHKTKYDYANTMAEWWKQDLLDMVEKDYNHPSVILYSTGNEVAETAQKKGIALTGEMTEYLHSLDSTRPVTCGINIFFNLLSSLGFGVYSDKKANKESTKKPVGSEFYNVLAGILGAHTMKLGATLYPCDLKTKGAYANMDIAGYNYGILRYQHDLKKYPKRLILGTETFCKDAYYFFELAKVNKRIIGDFVWAGMDYMGEAGIGAWEYENYAPKNAPEEGWLTAGSGRLNILGKENGEALYTKVAFEQVKGPLIAVRPIYKQANHSPSAWKMTDALESWSFPNCEGQKAQVEVYARAAQIELFMNGKSAGRKQLKNTCRACFAVLYEPGELLAVARDKNGSEIGKATLRSAGLETKLTVIPEKATVQTDEIIYIQIHYTDDSGIWKPMIKESVTVTVDGGMLLGLGNACSYNPDGYLKDCTKTYYGEALAAVRATSAKELIVNVSDGIRNKSIRIGRN